jgi:hypothetical protein
MNTYAYVGGNPINTIDPLGLYWEMADGEPRLVIGDDPPITTFIENARNNGQLTEEQAQLAHEGYLNIPKPSANSPFVQKLQAVFSEAAFQLAENPAYNGNAGLIAFAQLLQQDAPMIAGMMAAFAAIQFLPPPWNVGIDSLLIATGMTMVGVDGVQLIAYLLRMASEIDDTDICDGERLQGLGEELAEELFNRGLEVAEGALLGGLGAMGSLSRAFRNLNNRRPLNGESHEEMTDEIVRRMENGSNSNLLPRVDISNRFNVQLFEDGSRTYRYGNPDEVHGIEVHVDADGVLGFNIRAQGDSAIHGSGRDMFNSAMLRLERDNVQVNQIRGYWESGTDSVNFTQYTNNINSMSPEQAALNTWTGRLARDHGFGNVVSIQERFGDIIVVFGN